MICPNCDGMLNASGCQACGWKTGESFPAHRLVPGTANPLKDGFGLYPPQIGEPRVMHIVQPAIVPVVAIPEPVTVEPVPIVELPIPDPVIKSVQ